MWYVFEAARPVSLTSWRTPSALAASHSTGSTPSGPHCTVPVDGSDVVQATEAEYDDTCAGPDRVIAKPGRGGETVTPCVEAGGVPPPRYPTTYRTPATASSATPSADSVRGLPNLRIRWP